MSQLGILLQRNGWDKPKAGIEPEAHPLHGCACEACLDVDRNIVLTEPPEDWLVRHQLETKEESWELCNDCYHHAFEEPLLQMKHTYWKLDPVRYLSQKYMRTEVGRVDGYSVGPTGRKLTPRFAYEPAHPDQVQNWEQIARDVYADPITRMPRWPGGTVLCTLDGSDPVGLRAAFEVSWETLEQSRDLRDLAYGALAAERAWMDYQHHQQRQQHRARRKSGGLER